MISLALHLSCYPLSTFLHKLLTRVSLNLMVCADAEVILTTLEFIFLFLLLFIFWTTNTCVNPAARLKGNDRSRLATYVHLHASVLTVRHSRLGCFFFPPHCKRLACYVPTSPRSSTVRFIKGRQRDQMDAFPDGSKALASAAACVYTRGAASGGGGRAEGEVVV